LPIGQLPQLGWRRCPSMRARWSTSKRGGNTISEHSVPPVRIGDRVRITGTMTDDPDPLPIGSEGTVEWVGQWTSELSEQIGVAWDNGRQLLPMPSARHRPSDPPPATSPSTSCSRRNSSRCEALGRRPGSVASSSSGSPRSG
jgi:hypothetical protein